MKKTLFVINPIAGKGLIKSSLLDIIDTFCKNDMDVTVYTTQQEGDATKACEERAGDFDMIVCSGGDGTLDEVVNGVHKANVNVPIGYIPAGSTNDFASSLGISSVMKRAAQTIVDGKDYKCDVGIMNGESFVYIAAFGLFTDVSYETRQDLKNLLGHVAYIMEGMKKISEIRSYHMKLMAKDLNLILEDDFIFGMVTNSVSVGGFKKITGKYVELDDGVFEVTLVKMPKNMIELSNIMASLLDRDIDTNYMYCFKTNHLIMDSEEEISWTRDGEFGGAYTHAEIINDNKGITIRVPDKKS